MDYGDDLVPLLQYAAASSRQAAPELLAAAVTEIERLQADNIHLRELLMGDDPPEIDRLRSMLVDAIPALERHWTVVGGGPEKSKRLALLQRIREAVGIEQSAPR